MPRVLNKRTDQIPPDAIYVGRPSKWGNPHNVKAIRLAYPWITLKQAHEEAVARYKGYLELSPTLLNSLEELRGKDLVCWCAPLPCHADVLLKLANEQ